MMPANYGNFGTFDYGNVLRNVNEMQNRNALTQSRIGSNELDNRYRQKLMDALDYDMQNPDSAASYNKNPTFVRSADGQGGWVIKAFQLNDAGTAPKEVKFPGGALPAIRGSWVDVGDGKQLLMPYDTSGQSPISAPPEAPQGAPQGAPPVAPPQSSVTASENAPTQQPATPNFIPQKVPTVDTPEHKAAVVTRQEQAKDKVKQEVKKRENAKSYASYEITRNNVARSMKNTTSGYFAGKVPAVAATAQIAEHANNVLFPAIKKLVREGESGVFTDQDAMDVRKLMPTRETHPDALPMVMWQLDSWVATRMEQAQPPMPEGTIPRPSQIGADDPRWNQLSNEEKMKLIEAYSQ